MPWEISIVQRSRDKNRALGHHEALTKRFAQATPPINFQREIPTRPPQEAWDLMPEIIREQVMEVRTSGSLELGELSMDFWTEDDLEPKWIVVEVRGKGEPMAVLRSICELEGWVVMENKTPVDLNEARPNAWDRYCRWAGQAIMND